jgi:hypothetical protein
MRQTGGTADFHQIQSALPRDLQGLKRHHDAELFSLVVDHANLFRANPFVGTDKGFGRSFVECYGIPPKFCEGAPSRDEYSIRPETALLC